MSVKQSEPSPSLEETILRFVRGRTGLGEPGEYQFDALYIDEDEEHPEGGRTIRFRYVFDQDGASQYDKTLAFEGSAIVDAEVQIVASDLKLEHVGVAAHYRPPAGLVDE
ncbi:MAG: hypothetical protein E3J64_02335 [Anaerolineales bacterium]|nr:MAG: hypothetical protein E3J64_02335 [Anaerolineales bacterium]